MEAFKQCHTFDLPRRPLSLVGSIGTSDISPKNDPGAAYGSHQCFLRDRLQRRFPDFLHDSRLFARLSRYPRERDVLLTRTTTWSMTLPLIALRCRPFFGWLMHEPQTLDKFFRGRLREMSGPQMVDGSL